MDGKQAHEKGISRFWLVTMALPLAAAFVLPNHYYPWSCFHSEALGAAAMAIPLLWVFLVKPGRFNVYRSSLGVATVLLLALLQYLFGLIPLWGTFWISAVYVLGFFLSLHCGWAWERWRAGQCMDYLAIAMLIAAVVSLPIECMQWLGVQWSTPLLMQASNAQRPFANLAQPNLLADLYLLGVLAASWLSSQRNLPAWLAWLLAALFMVGAALTGSRAAWVNVGVVLIFLGHVNRHTLNWRKIGLAAALVSLFYALAVLGPQLQAIHQDSVNISSAPQFSTSSANSRLTAWKVLGLASLQSPWFGYGWGQVIKVNFVFAEGMNMERGLFSQSHNLFLDLILWNGYPLGILFSLGLVLWVGKLLRLPKTPGHTHVQAAVLILFLHSMIEFPVYYTYFLFPAGMMLGTVQAALERKPVFTLPRYTGLALAVLGVAVLFVTARDYFLIERSFYALRYESRGYTTELDRTTPRTWALNQMEEHLRVSRSEPSGNLDAAQLAHMEDVVRATPGAYIMYKLALDYGLAGNTEKASFWLQQICEKTSQSLCTEARQKWQAATEKYISPPLMAWPLH